MSLCLDGKIGCKNKTSSWHLIRFPDGSSIGSTVSRRGEADRYALHIPIKLPWRDTKTKTKYPMSRDTAQLCEVEDRMGGSTKVLSHYYPSRKLRIDKAGGKILLSDECLKKNLNESKLSEHPSDREKICQNV